MAEHGEERIFGEIGALRFGPRFLRGLVKSGVIERERGAMSQLFRERKLCGAAYSARHRVFTITIAPSTRSCVFNGTAIKDWAASERISSRSSSRSKISRNAPVIQLATHLRLARSQNLRSASFDRRA